MTPRKRKLIEVALPLDAINAEAAADKNPFLKGHPRNVGLWWSRKPLGVCRAVLFASLVDDPSSHLDRFPTEKARRDERARLFELVVSLARWEAKDDVALLAAAQAEIARDAGQGVHMVDPFAGGGSIPLEAARLGLSVSAFDLNPVAVLLTKSLLEIPSRFLGMAPMHGDGSRLAHSGSSWPNFTGLSEDIRHYGSKTLEIARRRLGSAYPAVRSAQGDLRPLAWLWVRTATCPNPACRSQMPLASKFWLSTKASSRAWLEPIVDRGRRTVTFAVATGTGVAPPGTVDRRGARCLVCDQSTELGELRRQAMAEGLGYQMVAIAVRSEARTRSYVAVDSVQASAGADDTGSWELGTDLPARALGFRIQRYGARKHRDLFTARQRRVLSTLAEVAAEVAVDAQRDAEASGRLPDDEAPLRDGGAGPRAFGEAILTYLALAVSQLTRYSSVLSPWNTTNQNVAQAFGRQSLPMIWDFAEANLLDGPLEYSTAVEWVASALNGAPIPRPGTSVTVESGDATQLEWPVGSAISTDPPYYDNIGYADLADFFYVWLRPTLQGTFPALFATVLTPKDAELIAEPSRFAGNRQAADYHFESGLRTVFAAVRKAARPDVPITIYYAFKQAEDVGDDGSGSKSLISSTGWETMLQGLIDAGIAVLGTWPMRTERATRMVARDTNALASSIVLVCRPRTADSGITTRRDFVQLLKQELPSALKTLQAGNIAPVDLAQASIGPGMAVFSTFSKVLEPDGTPMRVRTALAIINQTLDQVLTEQEGEFDADTRWAIAWYEQFGLGESSFGTAETLSKAKPGSTDAPMI
ncbi:MAG: DUF1156 domain-containing protein [Chloroflexi bacterium]|nr:DUF1156 domain-containing protein [Chloroflexota bacterium]